MSNLAIGCRPDTDRYAGVWGVCVCIGSEVLEAVTVEGERAYAEPARDPETGKAVPGNPVPEVDTLALNRLARDAWRTVTDIIRDHGETIRARCADPRPLVVIEATVPSRRAPMGRGRALEKVAARYQSQAALAMLLSDQDLELVPSDEFENRDPDWYPAVLNGPHPKEWRGRKGADRAVQRAAWAIAQAGLAARGMTTGAPAVNQDTETPVVPATPQEYVAALRASVRDLSPSTTADVLAAARHALDTVPRPSGVPDNRVPTPLQVAVDAVTRVGIAPHLNTPEGLAALAESAGH